jgi:hypothetical protein
MCQLDVNMLAWIFRNAGTDNGEIFFLVTAGRARVDKSGGAGLKVFVPDKTLC